MQVGINEKLQAGVLFPLLPKFRGTKNRRGISKGCFYACLLRIKKIGTDLFPQKCTSLSENSHSCPEHCIIWLLL